MEQTRDLWQRIQRIEDPVTRTLKELAYMQLFRPMWLDSVNEQYYIDYPHRRPDPEAERRKVQERLANVPPVILQAAYDMVRKEEQGPLVLLGDERGRNGMSRQALGPLDGDAAEQTEMSDKGECFEKKYLKAAETVDHSGKSGIMSDGGKALAKITSSEIPPMDKETFWKIRSGLLKKSVKIIQDEDGDAFLRFMGAEAMTLSDGSGIIFQSGRIPSASAVYEEVIHIAQIKQKGSVSSDDVLEYLKREIEANEKVLKNKRAYKLTEPDVQSIEKNLDYYYKRLKEVTSNVQDED